MSDPANEPAYEQLGEDGNPFGKAENPDALIEGNRVATAGDMESSDDVDATEGGGYEGEAPNLPLASQGQRDGTSAEGDNNNQ
jgi:hypothetical protein